MTERERMQQEEIERLQKKIKSLTEAYGNSAKELKRLKEEVPAEAPKRRGRPGLDGAVKARILALKIQGKTTREISAETGTAVGTVHKVIAEAAERSRTVYVYMDRDRPSTIIDTYPAIRKVKIMNLTDDMLERAFGVRENPDWNDFEEFMESRCMPRTRYGIREELRYMGLEVYDPFQIVEITDGRVYGDGQWIRKMDRDWVEQYDAVLKEKTDSETLRETLKNLVGPENRGGEDVAR